MLEKVYAANVTVGGVGTNVTSPLDLDKYGTLGKIFGLAMNVIMGVAVSLGVIFLGLGGIQYITAKGDAKAADSARTSITNAIIGILIAIGALVVKTVVLGSILGANEKAIDNSLIMNVQS